MTILPQFFNLFIYFYTSSRLYPFLFLRFFFFNVLHSVLSPHTWEGKHPRPIFKSLKLKGGLQHFNNFCFYYWAANISCLVFLYLYLTQSGYSDWVTMELHSNNSTSFLAVLGSPLSTLWWNTHWKYGASLGNTLTSTFKLSSLRRKLVRDL